MSLITPLREQQPPSLGEGGVPQVWTRSIASILGHPGASSLAAALHKPPSAHRRVRERRVGDDRLAILQTIVPRGLWTLTGYGKPWTATKSSKKLRPPLPTALGKPANGRRFPTAPTGRGARQVQNGPWKEVRILTA